MTDLSDESADGRRPVLPGNEVCLHCVLWEAINSYHERAGLKDHNGQLIYDANMILGHLGDLIAEFLASIPDRNARRHYRGLFDQHVREKLANYIASGNHPPSISARRH
jgi:hypothetical protein